MGNIDGLHKTTYDYKIDIERESDLADAKGKRATPGVRGEVPFRDTEDSSARWQRDSHGTYVLP